METATREQYEQRIAELATFCFHKLASLEARFITLCFRAQAVGVDCSDLMDRLELTPVAADESGPAVH